MSRSHLALLSSWDSLLMSKRSKLVLLLNFSKSIFYRNTHFRTDRNFHLYLCSNISLYYYKLVTFSFRKKLKVSFARKWCSFPVPFSISDYCHTQLNLFTFPLKYWHWKYDTVIKINAWLIMLSIFSICFSTCLSWKLCS